MPVRDFKSIAIYVDKEDTLYAVPTGENPYYNIDIEIDILNILKSPYSNDEIYDLVIKTFDQCYTMIREDIHDPGPLHNYFNVKTYGRAVKGLKYIYVNWSKDEGYKITPTKRVPREGFIHLEDLEKELGHALTPDTLSYFLKQAISESSTY